MEENSPRRNLLLCVYSLTLSFSDYCEDWYVNAS